MLWLLPVACSLIGLVVLTVLATRLRREVEPTVVMIDRFGREHRVAMTDAIERVRAHTATARQRLSDD
jgi:cytochrome c-type biogenesis protein CcmH/NrfF